MTENQYRPSHPPLRCGPGISNFQDVLYSDNTMNSQYPPPGYSTAQVQFFSSTPSSASAQNHGHSGPKQHQQQRSSSEEYSSDGSLEINEELFYDIKLENNDSNSYVEDPRKEVNRMRSEGYRAKLSDTQKREVREKQRMKQHERRLTESSEERGKRLARSAERQRMKRQNMTDADKAKLRELNKMRTRERRANETEEQREYRKIKDRVRMREKRALMRQVKEYGPDIVAHNCVKMVDLQNTNLVNSESGNITLTVPPSILYNTSSATEKLLAAQTAGGRHPIPPPPLEPKQEPREDLQSIPPLPTNVPNSFLQNISLAPTKVSPPPAAIPHIAQSWPQTKPSIPPLINFSHHATPNNNSSSSSSTASAAPHAHSTRGGGGGGGVRGGGGGDGGEPGANTALYSLAREFLTNEHQKYLVQLEKQRIRSRMRRQNETPEQRALRLQKEALRQRIKRNSLSGNDKVKTNEVKKLQARKRRSEELPNQRDARRLREKLRRREQRHGMRIKLQRHNVRDIIREGVRDIIREGMRESPSSNAPSSTHHQHHQQQLNPESDESQSEEEEEEEEDDGEEGQEEEGSEEEDDGSESDASTTYSPDQTEQQIILDKS